MTDVRHEQEDAEVALLHRRLQSLLHELTEFSEGERVLVKESTPNSRYAIKKEVLETQLPRVLTFRNDCKETLSLIVSAGRVLRGGEPTTAALLQGLIHENAFHFARRADDHFGITQVIQRFAARTKDLRVRVSYLDEAENSPSQGFDIDTIEKAMPSAVGRGRAAEKTFSLESLITSCSDLAECGLVLNQGEFTTEFGSTENLKYLKMLSEKENESRQEMCEDNDLDLSEAHFVLYSGEPEKGKAVFCAWHDMALGLVLLRNEHIPKLLKLWPGS